MGDLAGKYAIVTGATSGIGLETAAALAERGAAVILGVRNVKAGEEVAAQIRARVAGAKVEVGPALDLQVPATITAFAAEMNRRQAPVNILVNNAGIGYIKKGFTEEGVGFLNQVNYLGGYALTRSLEKKLVASKARVVHVASVTHRMARIRSVREFFTDFKQGLYQHAKLGTVLFSYELQRRLGDRGLQSVVADPGAVRSNIWSHSPKLSRGFMKLLVDTFYAPTADGATAVIHAATVPWEKERRQRNGTPMLPHDDLRYYSRGTFAWPLLCNFEGVPGHGLLSKAGAALWTASTAVHSIMDYPLRKLSGGLLCSATRLVRSARATYDAKLAAELWDVSADFAKLPKAPQV